MEPPAALAVVLTDGKLPAVNVLLVTADQHKATTVGAYGDPLGATPNLDRLAAQGTTFTRCRTQNPFCQPARATILTGVHPSTHGILRNGIDLPDEAVDESVATHLARAGAATAFFGHAHFASRTPDFPTGRVESIADSAAVPPDWCGPYVGFSRVELSIGLDFPGKEGKWSWAFGPPPFGLHYARHLFRDGHDRGVERLRLMQPEAAGRTWDHTQTWKSALPEEDHVTTWIADRTIEWLRNVPEPFFAWVSFTAPHHPFDPPHPWCDRYDPAGVGDVIPKEQPGELEAKPAMHRSWSEGLRGTPYEWANPGWATLTDEERRTMVAAYYGMVAQVDHAVGRIVDALDQRGAGDRTLVAYTADHGEYLGDHQLLFKGPIHYESLVRVPLVVRGPGFKPGARVDEPAGTIDLAPTFLHATGVPAPDALEGTSLTAGTREHVLTETEMLPNALRLRTLTTKQWRITRDLDVDDNGELYDLSEDPGELVNRWSDPGCAAVRSDLVATLHDVMRHDLGRELPQVCQAG